MDSDLESSSSSSFTAVDSLRSQFSDFSSLSSFRSSAPSPSKPHKSNQIEWEAIKSLRSTTASAGIRLDHFRLVRRLGSGDLGNVYLCQLRDDHRYSSCLYAMKVVDREALAVRKKLRRAETEKEILRSLDHPFLPTLYADFEAHHYSCLVMEFCPGGDLYVARQRQPERRFTVASAKFYAAETILALEYLHMMGVVYRDLKPENVLVRDDGHIMLSDFDLSFKCVVVPKLLRAPLIINNNTKTTPSSCVPPPMQPVISCFYTGRIGGTHKVKVKPNLPPVATALAVPTGEETNIKEEENQEDGQFFNTELVAEPITARSKSFVGTHEYLAPEVISGTGHGGAVDWWTLGVFLYEMIYGKTPFKGENNEKTIINIMKQQLSFPKLEGSKDLEELLRAQDLISKLLVKNPKKRIGSLKGSVEIKRHEFFNGVNWALIRSVKPPEVPKEQRSAALVRRNSKVVMSKLSKKEREEPFQIPQYFDYF